MISLDAVSMAPIMMNEADDVRDPDEGYLLTGNF